MVFLRKVNRWVLLFYGTEETVNTPEADRAKVLEQLTDQICLVNHSLSHNTGRKNPRTSHPLERQGRALYPVEILL